MNIKNPQHIIIILVWLITLSSCGMEKDTQSELGDILNTKPANQQPTPILELGNTQLRNTDGMTMVYVPAGQFEMGSDDLETCLYTHPAHVVSLDTFWIDQTEVTNSMFTIFLNEQGNLVENGINWLEPGAGHTGA